MYASVRRYVAKPGASGEISSLVDEGFVPIISQGPGFVAYFVVEAGNDVIASVSLFEDKAGAEDSNRLAADWVRENLAPLLEGSPDITAGKVTVYEGP